MFLVQIPRGICTPGNRLDRFSRDAQATNWIEVTIKNEFVFYDLSCQKS